MREPTNPSPGDMLDRYELITPLARGGMGSVHLARLPGAGGFQRLFAIKVMHPHLADEREFVDMLLDEARIAARIHHPNAVPIVDVCQSDKGFYLVMEYIDGVTLTKLLVDTRDIPWRQRARAAIRVVLDALAGLHAAHELTDDDGRSLGLVHRDVSPQNILVGTDGAGRITDFGIALAASRIASSRPGLLKGKPAYMSPEQVTASATVDRRADVFAMGIVLWESLTGVRLFHSDAEVGALMQVVGAKIEAPREVSPEVPASIDAVCMKALERPVDQRWPTARAMAEALEAAAVAEGLLATDHEVADLLRDTFADDFAARRALIRQHSRSGSAARIPVTGHDVPVLRAPITLASDSKSIPAIEVRSHPPGELPSAPRPPVAVAAPALAAAPGGATKARWVAPAVVGVALVASLAVWSTRRHDAPSVASPVARPTSPMAAVVASPFTAPAPVVHEVVAPAPVAPAVVAPAPSVAPVIAAPVIAAPATTRHAPRRIEADASVPRAPAQPVAPAQPAAPTHPTIEENPYLRR